MANDEAAQKNIVHVREGDSSEENMEEVKEIGRDQEIMKKKLCTDDREQGKEEASQSRRPCTCCPPRPSLVCCAGA